MSLAEANDFLRDKRAQARQIARGVFLCVLSPAALIFLGGLTEPNPYLILSDGAAMGAGMGVLFVLVAIAVATFILSACACGATRIWTAVHLIWNTAWKAWCASAPRPMSVPLRCAWRRA